jgi:hypothetical protein
MGSAVVDRAHFVPTKVYVDMAAAPSTIVNTSTLICVTEHTPQQCAPRRFPLQACQPHWSSGGCVQPDASPLPMANLQEAQRLSAPGQQLVHVSGKVVKVLTARELECLLAEFACCPRPSAALLQQIAHAHA